MKTFKIYLTAGLFVILMGCAAKQPAPVIKDTWTASAMQASASANRADAEAVRAEAAANRAEAAAQKVEDSAVRVEAMFSKQLRK